MAMQGPANVKFLPFRHFTIIKNVSKLNVRHAFQASYHRSLNLTCIQVSKYPENLTLVKYCNQCNCKMYKSSVKLGAQSKFALKVFVLLFVIVNIEISCTHWQFGPEQNNSISLFGQFSLFEINCNHILGIVNSRKLTANWN